MRALSGVCCGPVQGQGQQQPSLSSSAQAASRLATDAPQLAARITNAFGQSASGVLAASGDAMSPEVDLLTLAPQSERLGAAVSPAVSAQNLNNGAPVSVPAPAPAANTHTTKITSEVAAQGPLTSAAAQSPELPPLGLPKPPLHEFFDLPGELGILPALPGQIPLLPGPGMPH